MESIKLKRIMFWKLPDGNYRFIESQHKVKSEYSDKPELLLPAIVKTAIALKPDDALCVGEGCRLPGTTTAAAHVKIDNRMVCIIGGVCKKRECYHFVKKVTGVKNLAKDTGGSFKKRGICVTCKTFAEMSWCKRCESITYCSRECQLKDWKEHKKTCVKVESVEKKSS